MKDYALPNAIRFRRGEKTYDIVTALASFDGQEFDVSEYRKAACWLGLPEDDSMRLLSASDDMYIESAEAPLRNTIKEKTGLVEEGLN